MRDSSYPLVRCKSKITSVLTEWSLLESINELDYEVVPKNSELRLSKLVGGEVVID
jgi:hypothetical protein